ncbi:MAG: FAD-dependent oxidoreductase [Acidimicrobiales bacterium]
MTFVRCSPGRVTWMPRELPWLGRVVAARVGRRLGLLDEPERWLGLTHHYMPIGRRVAIVGGGLVGIELAEFLVEGAAVTVLEAGATMATEMAHPRRWRALTDLRDAGAVLVTHAEVTEIGAGAVTYHHGGDDVGEIASVDVDTVVIATGLRGDSSTADRLRAAGFDPVEIGDHPASVTSKAIGDGFRAGLAVG